MTSAKCSPHGSPFPGRAVSSTWATRRGFTLIEVLVVVAIIALLVAILMPTLQMAREASWSTECKSQVRQLAMGFHYYAGDYGEALPVYWDGTLRVTWVDLIAPYMKTARDAFRCESGPYGAFREDLDAGKWVPVDRFGRPVDPKTGASYGLNYYGIQLMWGNGRYGAGNTFHADGTGYQVLTRKSITGTPARFCVVMDAKGSSLCVPDDWLGDVPWTGSGETGPAYRHGGGGHQARPGSPAHIKNGRANFAFADGHAEAMDYESANQGPAKESRLGKRKYYRSWDPIIPR